MHWSTISQLLKKTLIVICATALMMSPAVWASTDVDSTASNVALYYSFQRMSFYDEVHNRFYVFYNNGSAMVYATSTDGSTWITDNNVRSAGGDSTTAIAYNGTHMAYVYMNGGTKRFRMGQPQADGTISWDATEQTVDTFSPQAYYPAIAFDTEGYTWIGYQWANMSAPTNDRWYPYAVKNSEKDGTWTNDGSPHFLLASSYVGNVAIPVALKNGKIYMVYLGQGGCLNGEVWDGSWQGSHGIPTSDDVQPYFFSASAINDTTHIVFKGTLKGVFHVEKPYGSTGIETTLAENGYPIIGKTNQKVIAFWILKDTIYYNIYDESWSDVESWITASNMHVRSLQVFYEERKNKLALFYLTGSQAPYGINFEQFHEMTVTFSASEQSPKADEEVTISWSIQRINGSSVSNFLINVSKNGLNWLIDETGTNGTEFNLSGQSNIYTATALSDLDENLSVFNSIPVTVTWADPAKTGGKKESPPLTETVGVVVQEEMAQRGLLWLGGFIGLIVMGGLISSRKMKKLSRKPKGVPQVRGRSPRGVSSGRGRTPTGKIGKRLRDRRGRFK